MENKLQYSPRKGKKCRLRLSAARKKHHMKRKKHTWTNDSCDDPRISNKKKFVQDDRFEKITQNAGCSKSANANAKNFAQDDRLEKITQDVGYSKSANANAKNFAQDDRLEDITQDMGCSKSANTNAKNFAQDDRLEEITQNVGCSNSANAKAKNFAQDDRLEEITQNVGCRTPAAVGAGRHNRDSSDYSSSGEDLIVDTTGQEEQVKEKLEGRRIVDIIFLFNSIAKINHSPFGCTFKDLKFVKEQQRGFKSKFFFECEICHVKEVINSEDPSNTFGINEAFVQGTICSGNGYAQLSEISAAANIPPMSDKTFQHIQNNQWSQFKKCAMQQMIQAGEIEKKLAIENNEIDVDGIPLISVVADASWAKRSYNNRFSSLSGVAVIVGYRTRKVLFLGVRNKYCCICDRASKENKNKPMHKCFKNWADSSTGMEEDIIAEGFLKSVQMHGLKYNILIGDGDSSVIKKIHEIMPYGPNLLIKKVECKNHLLRNFCTKTKQLAKKTNNHKGFVPVALRKKVEANVLRLRKAIVGAIKYRKDQGNNPECVENLRNDIKNSASHVFGCHDRCADYFCKRPNEPNLLPELQNSGIWVDIQQNLSRLVNNASSLILDVTNNMSEQFHSVICKFIGGKRINYTSRGSYEARCFGALISWNSERKTYDSLQKVMCNKSPGKYTKQYTERKHNNLKKRRLNFENENKTPKRYRPSSPDQQYGVLALEDDLPKEVRMIKEKDFLEKLKLSEEERQRIATQTIGQSDNNLWATERRKRITASIFGRVCKMTGRSNGVSIVNQQLYSNFRGNAATKYGKENEEKAILQFSQTTGFAVSACGLYVDRNHPYLGASPDGLIGTDSVVEVKCPYNISDVAPLQAIEQKKIKFCKIVSGQMKLKRNHDYYYQVQGQLHITERKFAFFIVWTEKGLEYEKIERDDEFWQMNMITKLENFYHKCVLKELIDPRKPRKMCIRGINDESDEDENI